MRPDLLHPITEVLSKMLPDGSWTGQDGGVYSMYIPLAIATDNKIDSVPHLLIKLNEKQYKYIKNHT